MAEPLKRFFDAALIREIAASLRAAHPALRTKAFVAECLDGLDDLELTARAGHVADAMRRHLPADFAAAADVIVRSLGPALDVTEGFGMAPFRYLPHVLYVARHGLAADDFEAAMRAQHELTRRFSAEFSIRAYLVAHPGRTLARLRVWARDPDVHVRRLVSEGTRPRLPWAPRLRAFQEDPTPVLALLELLRDDPERYVQRSVANNLNDIAKDHPAPVIEVCRRWLSGASDARRWIVGHALRSLVKQGDRGALATLGVGAAPAITIDEPRVTARARLGDAIELSFELASTAAKPQELLVDYAVHFVKANGAARPKVFKLRRLTLAAGERARLDARVSLASLTTRTPHPGRHRIEAIVNGRAYLLGACDVRR
jgi:3-methyladenine DNA glycosylase AlkC